MQVIIFNLGAEKYALDTNLIFGIEKMMNITHIPKSPKYVKGLSNLRGTIISVIDLKEFLSITSVCNEENVIIIDVNEEKAGLLVDSVDEVVEINNDMIEKIEGASKYIKGIINFENYIVTLIDGESIFR